MDGRGTIVILIDALGYELAKRHGFSPPGLSSPRRIRTTLGFSQAALTTILTGLTPSEHGLWMMYAFAAGDSPFRWLKAIPVSTRRRLLRNSIRWVLDNLCKVESYYSLYSIPREVLPHLDLPARERMFAPRGAGSRRNIFDELEARGTAWRAWDHTVDEERAFDELERSLESGNETFRFLYTAGLDSTMHEHGTDGERVRCHLEWYGDRIERIVARSRGERVVVLGDHGMCDVHGHLDLMSLVEGLGLRMHDDYVPFYDSTMARFQIRNEGARERLEQLLGGMDGGRLLRDEEAERLGVFFRDARFGDLIYLLDPGTIILPSFMGCEPVAAMHGYHPETACMYSAVLSNDGGEGLPEAPTDIAEYLLPGFEAGDLR